MSAATTGEFVVWKYPLPVTDDQWIELPADAELLKVDTQGGFADLLQLWARVDPSRPTVNRLIVIRGTGHPVGGESHIGTVMVAGGALVWHVFDGGEEGEQA